MRDLHKRLDSAIILITHDMGVVADLADRHHGDEERRIVERGTVDADLPPTRSTRTRSSCSPPCRTSARSARSRSTRRRADRRRVQLRLAVIAAREDAERREALRARCWRSRTSRSTTPSAAASPPSAPSSTSTFSIYPRRDRRSRRRVRLGQDHPRPRRHRAAPDRRGQADGRRRRHLQADQQDLLAIRAQGLGIVFQDPGSSLNPRLPIGQSIGEPILLAGRGEGQGPRQAGRDAARPGRAAACVPQPLPARAVRRSAPARRHRT